MGTKEGRDVTDGRGRGVTDRCGTAATDPPLPATRALTPPRLSFIFKKIDIETSNLARARAASGGRTTRDAIDNERTSSPAPLRRRSGSVLDYCMCSWRRTGVVLIVVAESEAQRRVT